MLKQKPLAGEEVLQELVDIHTLLKEQGLHIRHKVLGEQRHRGRMSLQVMVRASLSRTISQAVISQRHHVLSPSNLYIFARVLTSFKC